MRRVNQYDKKGDFIQSFSSIKEAAKQTGVSSSNITKCCKSRRNRAGDFKWKYKIFD